MHSEIGVLKFLFMLEKSVNIHRDFCNLKKKKRLFLVFCIFFDIFVCTAVAIITLLGLAGLNNPMGPFVYYSTFLFLVMFILYGFSSILFDGPSSGKTFLQILRYFDKGHKFAGNSFIYNKCIKSLKIKCGLVLTIFLLVRIIGSTIQFMMQLNQLIVREDILNSIMYSILRIWIEYRFVVEILMFYSCLTILHCNLSHLGLLLKTCDNATEGATEKLNTYAKMYDQWTECSKQLVLCFGQQIQWSVAIVALHIVSILYRYVHLLLMSGTFLNVPSTYGQVLLYAWSTMALAAAGQSTYQDWRKLNLYLAKLLYRASKNPESAYFKSLKDFYQLVSRKPIEVKLLGRPIGMYVLPAALSFSINSVIVILQLNHDV